MKFLVLAIEKHGTLRAIYGSSSKNSRSPGQKLTAAEEQLVVALEDCRLIKFLHHNEGLRFIQMVIVAQATRDYSNWLLLSRVF